VGAGCECGKAESPSTSSTLFERLKQRRQDAWERMAEL